MADAAAARTESARDGAVYGQGAAHRETSLLLVLLYLLGGDDCLSLKQRQAAQCVPGAGFHLAFAATDTSAVDAFHRAALQHGGCCNGAPGLRPDYGDACYAAFVIDPDGHHLEAVVDHTPPQ
ncbi:VOC family protein [Xanthomonas nasturtii]|uniref:VOC family protein n=1 Tax=Xanthomonas nasturtii TaxID=1843581 RepID=UPI002010F7FD|nr:VOC family protein [Xanthomonas nasturtii]MCL1498573.1 VOC family protein [Xanthomonas nasturtii]MCL1504553.1 VOC family protein [Xanthomonas nasturtii]MCL1523579.1 VOC family protein [Xanthomonas nasturtii]